MASIGSKAEDTAFDIICEMCGSKSRSHVNVKSTAKILTEAARLGHVECVKACLAEGDGVNTFGKERFNKILPVTKGGRY